MSAPLAAIVGVAESDLGTTSRTPLQLIAQATSRALDEAGLRLSDVDGIACAEVARFSCATLAEYLGLQPIWSESTFAGGASFELFLARAAEAIHRGQCETVLIAYGSNQRTARLRALAGVQDAHTLQTQFETPYGPLLPVSLYAMAAQRHMHDYGTTPRQLAEVAVAAREWARLNPAAWHHDSGPLTHDGVCASPLISTPLHKYDCCLVTDGGGAVVVTSVERARDLPARAVGVIGHGECTTSIGMAGLPDLTRTGAAVSGAAALRMADKTIDEIDVVQIYDSFTITVLLTLEALGVCPRGEAGAFVEGGTLRPGGACPINTSGGGLSYCHPGMFGIFLIIEAVRQLQGSAGARQLDRAHTALCHGTGGIFSTHATVVLEAL